MTKTYKVVPMLFNSGKFALAIRLKIDKANVTKEDVAALANISDTTVASLASGLQDNPKMQTFLGICNALDLNPLDYFELAE